jgi:FKBP-type peptidyl-prolyl cis-trans isomerase (trigger factor)
LLSGELDAAFGVGGVVTLDFDLSSERFERIVAGPGGKVYAAGFRGGKVPLSVTAG